MPDGQHCGNCKHFYSREWESTHGTCEWVDYGDAAPKWLTKHWPSMRKNDDTPCQTWAAGTFDPTKPPA